MSKEEPAFPLSTSSGSNYSVNGLTKREWFAAMATEEDVNMAWRLMSKDLPDNSTASRYQVRFFHADQMIEASKRAEL